VGQRGLDLHVFLTPLLFPILRRMVAVFKITGKCLKQFFIDFFIELEVGTVVIVEMEVKADNCCPGHQGRLI
jgi:hypothetical protein